MTFSLSPAIGKDDLLLRQGGKTSVVLFVDYLNPTTRRLRSVFSRSVDRFERINPTVAIRFHISDQNREASERAARAAFAAYQQGRFAAMHAALFDLAESAITHEGLNDLALSLGLDVDQFARDMASDAATSKLANDASSAQASHPVPHSPIVYINGIAYEGVWDENAIVEAMENSFGVRLELASKSFYRWAASAGFVLVLATIAALLFVNLGGHDLYEHWRETLVGITFGDAAFRLPVELWVNDGLMAVFFLIVGIEIKRELLDGELSSPERAALPLIGALGGMIVPALVFAAFNAGTETAHGWGVPMATDIAFTLGILALLGSRVPTSLKVFVSALAIADDLGAILVIAIFYGHGFHVEPALMAIGILAAMAALNIGRVYSRTPYLILGVMLWYFTFESGLHATLAGVLTAAAIPSRPAANLTGAALQAQTVFQHELHSPHTPAAHGSIAVLERIVSGLRDPGFRLQHALEGWSNYLILPLFAFFNTGIVVIGADFTLTQPAVSGAMAGLIFGKSLGIFGSVYLASRLGLAKLSPEVSWTQLFGAACLCGIGFTMSIFIASAAFSGAQLQSVKLAVLLASAIAATIGTVMLWRSATVNAGSA